MSQKPPQPPQPPVETPQGDWQLSLWGYEPKQRLIDDALKDLKGHGSPTPTRR
jgi:hypothetical protein